MTRAEVAAELGVAKSTVWEWQRRGELAAERVDGVDYFERSEVSRRLLERAAAKPKDQRLANIGAGELAGRVFDALAGGMPPAELVTKFRITPEAAIEYVAHYNKLVELPVTRASSAPRCAHEGCTATARFCGEHPPATKPPVAKASRA